MKIKCNISKHKWQDILNLKKNKDIIIKEADKGGAKKKKKKCLTIFSYNTSNYYCISKIYKSKLVQNVIKEH